MDRERYTLYIHENPKEAPLCNCTGGQRGQLSTPSSFHQLELTNVKSEMATLRVYEVNEANEMSLLLVSNPSICLPRGQS